MAGNGYVQLPLDSLGKKVDCVSLSASGQTVYRQIVSLGDPTASAGYAAVTAGALQVQVKNASIPVSGQVSVTGSVAISNTVTVQGQVSVTGSVAISNNINISAMPTVTVNPHLVSITGTAVVVLAAGTSNIGTINNISATVNVAGTFTISTINNISAPVALAAGTANIGTVGISSGTLVLSGMLDGISATVNVAGNFTLAAGATVNISAMPSVVLAAGSNEIGYLKGISGTVQTIVTGFSAAVNVSTMPAVVIAAGTNQIGYLQKISATVGITGTVALVAGTANIGSINNISATVNVSVTNQITVANISATVNVAGTFTIGALATGTNNIGTVGISSGTLALSGMLDGISATVNVAGNFTLAAGATVNVSAMPTVNVILAGQSSGYNLFVQGGIFAGSPVSTATLAVVLVGGSDGTNAKFLKTDANGSLVINNISASVVVTGQVSVTGSVAISNNINISAMPQVVLATGSNEIGYLKGISGTVQTIVTGFSAAVNISAMPAVALAAGAANIGTVNNISAAVVLAAGTANIGSINNISATIAVVLAAGTANIGTIQAISAPVTIANGATVNISTMPAVNISAMPNINVSSMPTVNVNLIGQSANYILYTQGGIAFNASITAGNAPMLMGGRVKTSVSTTATAHAAVWAWFDKGGRQITQLNAASLHPSATHGPKTVTLSASANTVLVASAGTACIFIDSLIVTSNLAAVTRCDIYETPSSAAPEVSGYLAIGGGGFTHKFDPPWQLSAGQALSARLKPSASAQVLVMVHFHVGPN